MMPMFFVDKFRPRPRRAVFQQPRCSLFPRPSGFSDSVTPEQLQQLLLLADFLKYGEKPGQRKLTDKSAPGSSRGSHKKESGSVFKKHKRFCPYHCIKAEKEDEQESETFRQDCVAASEHKVAPSETHSDQRWATTLDCSAFKPTELKVQVDGDSVHVHALHDERSGGHRTTFEMRRVFQLPDDVIKSDLECVFSADSGQLVLTAPRRCTPPQPVTTSSDSSPSLTHSSDSQPSENAREASAGAPDTCPSKAEGKRKSETQVEAEEKRRRTEDTGNDGRCSAEQQHAPKEGRTTRTEASAAAEKEETTDTSKTAEERTVEAAATEEGAATETSAPEEGSTTEASEKEAGSLQDSAEDSGPAATADNCQQSHTSAEDSTTCAAGDTDATTPDDMDTSPTDSDVTAVADVTRGTSEMVRCDNEAPAPTSQKDFSLTFDVEKFSPEDLEVKVAGNVMTLRGKREVNEDGFCFVERMERKVTLPDLVDPDNLKCVFTKDGHLVVKVA